MRGTGCTRGNGHETSDCLSDLRDSHRGLAGAISDQGTLEFDTYMQYACPVQ